jgi:HK97 family phage major capsid protein
VKTFKEWNSELTAKREQAAAIFAKYPGITPDEVDTWKQLQVEMNVLKDNADKAWKIEEEAAENAKALDDNRRPTNQLETPSHNPVERANAKIKTLSQILGESKEYAAFRAGNVKTAVIHLPQSVVDAELKTLMTLSTINNLATRLPGIRESAQETASVADLMLSGATDNNQISYMEETTFTNAAVEVAEGAAKPESALGFTETTEPVRKIATWIPATDELLADVAGIESYIRGRLGFMIQRREEAQLLAGNGTAPNISGITDRTGLQTQAKGSDPTPDAVYKAMVKIMVNAFADPTAVVFHPNDWQDIRLLRTTDGIYIWGSPADVGPDRIWGLPVRKTTAMTENTALVGAFTPHAQVFRRTGITVTISTEHSTYFTENKVAILAEERLALAVYRPAAFCTVTGI